MGTIMPTTMGPTGTTIMRTESGSSAPEHTLPGHAIYQLMSWLSPSYPVGAYSYSHGIEWVVEVGTVRDAASLQCWVENILSQGGGWNDAVFFAQAWNAVREEDGTRLREVAELAGAFAASRERKLETTAQGDAFVSVTERAWPCDGLSLLREAWKGTVAYPVAVAVAAAGHDIPLRPALVATLHAYAANLVSAGVRLIPLGQTDAQRIGATLMRTVEGVAERAQSIPLGDVGGVALLGDIAAMRHETQYTRLFRT